MSETQQKPKEMEDIEVPVMKQVINAYWSVIASDEFKEFERLRSIGRAKEEAVLAHARDEERAKWEKVIAEKDAVHAAELVEIDAALADKDALIAELKARLGEKQKV